MSALDNVIDTPIESLPFVDRHSITLAAPPQRTWDAMLEVVGHVGEERRSRALAKGLHCTPPDCEGEWGEIGSTVPGFLVTRAIAPAVLGLMGEHRFSRYALIFTIVECHSGLTECRAETRAEFPGGKGRLYRGLVIGTHGHVVITNGILRSIRKIAERPE
ncbi:hypothetical protein BH10ACT11_BH10ACT11_21430 [soil metagenome]